MNPLMPTPLDVVLSIAALAIWGVIGIGVCAVVWWLTRRASDE
jgi:hypothetical protein